MPELPEVEALREFLGRARSPAAWSRASRRWR